MTITARLEQPQADFTPTKPFTVREYIEEMEAAGVQFGFYNGTFYEDHTNTTGLIQTMKTKATMAGIKTEDLKAFFIAASRPGPSPVPASKSLFDLDTFQQRLKDLDPKDLVEVFDGLVAASNAMSGILNRPRCQESAGQTLEQLLDELGSAYSAIVSEVEGREVTGSNANQFFQIVAGYEIHCEGEPIDLARIAVKFAEAAQR